jgi:hypothetical protein
VKTPPHDLPRLWERGAHQASPSDSNDPRFDAFEGPPGRTLDGRSWMVPDRQGPTGAQGVTGSNPLSRALRSPLTLAGMPSQRPFLASVAIYSGSRLCGFGGQHWAICGRREVFREQRGRVGDGVTVGVQVPLRRGKRPVPGDLAEVVDGYSCVGTGREHCSNPANVSGWLDGKSTRTASAATR